MMESSPNNSKVVYGYRIVAPRWASSALSGEGARKYGGRWNTPGKPLIYLGGSRALSALEMLVHLTTPLSRKKRYQIIKVSIPENLIFEYPSQILPVNWRHSPPTQRTQEIGNDWLQVPHSVSKLALRVPSVLIPEETNILLNPAHPDIKKITQSIPVDFSFDPRL